MFFLRDSFRFPEELAQAFSIARWGSTPDSAILAREGKAIRALWEDLAKHRGMARDGEHYSFRRESAEAYASYYLPVNALKPALILEEAYLLGMDFLPNNSNWLDFGSGPGTMLWGLDWWTKKRGKKIHYLAWEQSPHFVKLGERLATGKTAKFFLADKKNPKDWMSKIREHAPTHLSFMNSIAEIFPDPTERLKAVKEILAVQKTQKARDGKERFLLIIEPGSRESSRELATLKDALEQICLLPCLDKRACGALVNPQDWCHEEASCEFPEWLNEIGAHAGMRKESLLFSYALLSTSEAPSAKEGLPRMVSQRLEQKGQMECHLCTIKGKRKARVQRSKSDAANEFFLTATRGDIFLDLELGEKNDVLAGRFLQAQEKSVF
jgi:hypothetical protein